MDVALALIAARQHGVISRSQAVTAGATVGQIRHRLGAGRWLRMGPGVYRLAGVPVTWRQRAVAACLVSGPGAVLSHRSAAVLWGISGFRPGAVEITVPMSHGVRNPLARVHRSAMLDGVVCDRIPVSRPARTLADLAGVVSGTRLEEAVDDVLCRRITTFWDELVRRAAEMGPRRGAGRCGRSGRPGTPTR